jgi:hypothetical protein
MSPWKVSKDGERYCVHKINADDSPGDVIPGGCHASKADASAHARALYASEAKEMTDAALDLLKGIAGDSDGDKPERASAVLDEWKARIALIPEEEDDEEELDEEKKKEFVETITSVPIFEEKTVEQCDTAEVTKPIAKKDLFAKLKDIGDMFKKLFKDEPEDQTGITVWKQGNQYWWMARYSNKFRDSDNPPEIISSESHKRFVNLVKEGKAPMPELWPWHKKEWKVGKAHGVAYDELGFAVALGTFDVGKENVAEALMKSKEPIKVSHGMPYSSIKRDEVDSTIIVEHETREISFLPAWAAANKLTGFAVLNLESKEESMAIPDETKKEWISNLGINPETLESLEAANAEDADKAVSEGLESKENEEAQPATQEPEAKSVETVTLTVADLQKAVQEAVTGIVAPVLERMNALEAGLTQVKETSDARDQALKGTPTASLSALLGQFATSAIGAPENRVDGRTSLAQSKPKETAANVPGRTLVPFINELLDGNKQ